MGQIYKLTCTNKQCGYEKTAQIGDGRTGMMLEPIREAFQGELSEELQEFEHCIANGLRDYGMGQRLALCRNCNDYVTARALRYAVNGITKVLYLPCECGNALLPAVNIEVNCVKCGGTLTAETAGLWD